MMDQPWQRMFGKRHRKVMHDEATVQWFTATYGPLVGQVVKGHLILDLVVSQYGKRQRQYLKKKYTGSKK